MTNRKMPESVAARMKETKTVTVGDINRALFGSSSVGQLETAMFSLQSSQSQLSMYHPELAAALEPALQAVASVAKVLIDDTARTLKVYDGETEAPNETEGSRNN